MQINVNEATGPALDWMVKMVECPYVKWDQYALNDGVWGRYSPSTNWALGGPIIARHDIEFKNEAPSVWRANISPMEDDQLVVTACGPTHLLAAMRCYVALKLGNVVDVPEDLI